MTATTPIVAPTTAQALDELANQLNQISETLAEVIRHGHIPTTAAAVFPLVWARGNLAQTANMIVSVADQLDHDGTRYTATAEHAGSIEHIADDRPWSDLSDNEREDFLVDEELADDAWADPRWAVDSATRSCCGGIGDHTLECYVDQPIGNVITC